MSADGQIFGTYVRGLFDRPKACDALLAWAGYRDGQRAPDMAAQREASLGRLADAVEAHLDTVRVAALLGLDPP